MEEALQRLSPLWDTLWELVPPSSSSPPTNIERPFMAATRAEALELALKFVVLHAAL